MWRERAAAGAWGLCVVALTAIAILALAVGVVALMHVTTMGMLP